MASDANERYRREQEEFVSNHGGSSSREVLLAILPSICGVLLTVSTLALIGKRLDRNPRNLLEFLLTVVPCVLCCTILSEYVATVSLAMLAVSIVNAVLVIASNEKSVQRAATKSPVHPITLRRPFITNFRALTNLLTAICILAVDFRAFPRKFAKTEMTGYSLMDTGVGLFVISNALVAPESRNCNKPSGSLMTRMQQNSKICVRNSAPLLILAIGRFIAIEFSSYQTHVTEYGVHWNFFATLAFAKMLASTLASLFGSRYSLVLGVCTIVMHEYALNAAGLKDWVLGDAPRNDFVSANREGLSSVPGYVGLYLVAVAIGRLISSTYENAEKRVKVSGGAYSVNFRFFGHEIDFEYNDSMVLCIKLSLIAVQACAATLYCDTRYGVSRRLANAGYCCWIVTLACTLMTLVLLVEIMTDVIAVAAEDKLRANERKTRGRTKRVGFDLNDPTNDKTSLKRVPEIFEALNYNGLAFFLLANLLTGLVNIFVKTLYADDVQALIVIFAYIATCIIANVAMYRRKLQMKF